MKGNQPKVTTWRAIVDGKQIGSGYATKFQALVAANSFIENEGGGHTLPEIDVKPSFAPIRELV